MILISDISDMESVHNRDRLVKGKWFIYVFIVDTIVGLRELIVTQAVDILLEN